MSAALKEAGFSSFCCVCVNISTKKLLGNGSHAEVILVLVQKVASYRPYTLKLVLYY